MLDPRTAVLLVPRGAEERAVRRAAPAATVIAMHAGAAAAQLPAALTEAPATAKLPAALPEGPATAKLPAALPEGLVIVLGLCGALRTLRAGASVIYRDVADEAGRYAIDGELIGALHAALPSAALVHACTVGHVVTRAAERVALAAAYGADVVDMEGTHVARALAARGRACVIVRVVSDDPSYDLPPIEDAFDADGAIRPLHLARAFATHPLSATRFIRDVRRALTTLGTIAATIAERA